MWMLQVGVVKLEVDKVAVCVCSELDEPDDTTLVKRLVKEPVVFASLPPFFA